MTILKLDTIYAKWKSSNYVYVKSEYDVVKSTSWYDENFIAEVSVEKKILQ